MYSLHAAIARKEYRANKFAAALKGIDLDEETSDTSTFDEIEQRAQAALAGKNEDEYVFDMIGIQVEADDD